MNEDHLQELATELDRARVSAGLSKKALANRTGLGRNTISAALNARRGKPVPTAYTVAMIVRECGVDGAPLFALHALAQQEARGAGPAPESVGPAWITTTGSPEAPPRHFDPLRRENLVRSVQWALQNVEPVPLDAVLEKFDGGGAYALYYTGSHWLYEPVASGTCTVPLYVNGIPSGPSLRRMSRPAALWRRLEDHRRTLQGSRDLDPADFMVRYLLVDDLFTEAAARLMIEDTRPVWNTMLMEGFGAHPAAATRGGVFNSRGRPAWYYVHGGRGSWPSGLDALPDPPEELLEGVRDHFRAMAAGSVVGTALPR